MNSATRLLLVVLLVCSLASQSAFAGEIQLPDDVVKNVADAKETLTGIERYIHELEEKIKQLQFDLAVKSVPVTEVPPTPTSCPISSTNLFKLEQRIAMIEAALANCQLAKFDTEPTQKLLKDEIQERTDRLDEMATSMVDLIRRRIEKTSNSGISRKDAPTAASVWESSRESFEDQVHDAMKISAEGYIEQAKSEIQRITAKSKSDLKERFNTRDLDIQSGYQGVAAASKESVSSAFERTRDKLKSLIELKTKSSDEEIATIINNQNWSVHLQSSKELEEIIVDPITKKDGIISGDIFSTLKIKLEDARQMNLEKAAYANAAAQLTADRVGDLRSEFDDSLLITEKMLTAEFDGFIRRLITRNIPRPVVISGADNEEEHFKALTKCFKRKERRCFIFDADKAVARIPYAVFPYLSGLQISFDNDNSCKPDMAPEQISVSLTSPMNKVSVRSFVYTQKSGAQIFKFPHPHLVREVAVSFASNRGNDYFTCVHEITMIRHG